jgi:alpha-amylase
VTHGGAVKSIKFLFGIHCHQPVGNFDHVFRQAFDDCYLPLIQTLKKHPKIRFAIHYSGPLIEWFEANEKSYLDEVGEMVERKQVEMLGGGFYEPILAVIPRKDALGQLNMMSDYLESRFGRRPRGAWLTERIWEPQIASILCEAGIEYTNTDDAHFTYSGLQAKDMFGYYVTEDNGSILKVFPTDKTLRYTIPFKLPEVTIKYLRSVVDESGTKSATLADDGEKFGVWPGTHKWVYTDGYLENLCLALEENEEWLHIKTFSEFIDSTPSMGRIYLPTAAYEEMMEWALPTSSLKGYEDFVDQLKKNEVYEQNKPYVRGGFWRNFMAKYPESNLMHKKMLRVSRKVNSSRKSNKEALRELWQSQCNCAYWHGLFGGLYLNYLRHAVYHHLINAENILDGNGGEYPRTEYVDHDMDGAEEFIVETKDMNCYISPNYGGSIIELDFRPSSFNLSNCLSRREEVYHEKVKEADKLAKEEKRNNPKSAHDIVHVKEAGLEKYLCYDRTDKFSFIDHILPAETTLDDFRMAKYREIGDFAGLSYSISKKGKTNGVVFLNLERTGNVNVNGGPIPVKVNKRFVFEGSNKIKVEYRFQVLSKESARAKFATELNFTMLAGDAEDRYYVIPERELNDRRLASVGEEAGVSELQMVDEWSNIRISIESDNPCDIWRFPVETVSQSEGGFERNYQNSCVVFLSKLDLSGKSETEVKFTLTLGPCRA